jgi:hypothetical protein
VQCSVLLAETADTKCSLQMAANDDSHPYLAVNLRESSKKPDTAASDELDWNGLVDWIKSISSASTSAGGGHLNMFIDDLDCLQYIAPDFDNARQFLSSIFRSCPDWNIILFGRSPVVANGSTVSSGIECDLSSIIGEYQQQELPVTLTEYCKYRYQPMMSL